MGDLAKMQELLKQVSEHLRAGTKSEKRRAVVKLQRISAISGTLALTIEIR